VTASSEVHRAGPVSLRRPELGRRATRRRPRACRRAQAARAPGGSAGRVGRYHAPRDRPSEPILAVPRGPI